jgi:hypothetical protein
LSERKNYSSHFTLVASASPWGRHFSSIGDAYTHLGVRLEARDQTQQRVGDYFVLVFLLNPDGTLLVDPPHIQSVFDYSIDAGTLLPGGPHFFLTNAVAVSCDSGYCGAQRLSPFLGL